MKESAKYLTIITSLLNKFYKFHLLTTLIKTVKQGKSVKLKKKKTEEESLNLKIFKR
jgi:hypothetical protein